MLLPDGMLHSVSAPFAYWDMNRLRGTRIKSADPEVIKLEYRLNLKIKRKDWLFVDTCPQAANHCALFWVWVL